jgi:RNA polymerase sigma-70 factor (ECF subfamily)
VATTGPRTEAHRAPRGRRIPLRPARPRREPLADRVVEEAVIAAAFESLSEDHRQVLVHAIWLDEPVARIAEALGVAPGTVKSRVHYALKALRRALDEMGYRS